MKKLLLALVFVFSAGVFVSAHSSTNKTVEEDFGCASDCVKSSRAAAPFLSAVSGVDKVTVFKVLYADCYYSNC